jgi:4-hydroxy-tetrahydrodipicolinate synthase
VTHPIEYLRDVWNIVPTPFTDDDELDLSSLNTLTDFVVSTGVTGMTILGVLGEASKLSDAERSALIEGVLRRADGRIPVCVGITAPSTSRAVGYAREAAQARAHSVLLGPPSLSRPSDDAIRQHFLAVADAIDLPIVIQDHPASSGVFMSVELLCALAAASPLLKVIKLEDEPSPAKIGRVLHGAAGVRILGGLGGVMLMEELRRGAVGTMTGFGYPEILVDVMRLWRTGNVDVATETFYRYVPLIRFESQAGLNLPIRKLIYQRRGAIRSAHVRAPKPTLDAATVADLDDLLQRLGLKNGYKTAAPNPHRF